MKRLRRGPASARLAARVEAGGLQLTIEPPDAAPIAIGSDCGRAHVRFHTADAFAALERSQLLSIAEAYLQGEIDVEGDFLEAMKVSELLEDPWELPARAAKALRLLLPRGRRALRAATASHYEQPTDLFLPWFDRSRCYSHGLYAAPDDSLEEAQQRKLERVVTALGLRSGMNVFEMGSGWGPFLEYAGRRGVRVHGITISGGQRDFCRQLILAGGLPCQIERADFRQFRSPTGFDGAVFMGSLEHFPDYRHVARFLDRHLRPSARVWADFCSKPNGGAAGAFLARHVFGGIASYVDVPRLLAALEAERFHVWELVDDTASYALTCRAWADGLDREQKRLAERFGERAVRTLRVMLRTSQRFLETGRTRAHHLVASRQPAPLSGAFPAALSGPDGAGPTLQRRP